MPTESVFEARGIFVGTNDRRLEIFRGIKGLKTFASLPLASISRNNLGFGKTNARKARNTLSENGRRKLSLIWLRALSTRCI